MKRILIATITLVGLVLAGCASATPEPVTFRVEMREYAFSPGTLEARVGQQVIIELVNVGVLPHELMIGRDLTMMESRPNGYQHDMFAEAGVEPEVMAMSSDMAGSDHSGQMGHAGWSVVLNKTGDTATIRFTVTDAMVGEWEMGCFEQEGVHYIAGMKGKFIVSK